MASETPLIRYELDHAPASRRVVCVFEEVILHNEAAAQLKKDRVGDVGGPPRRERAETEPSGTYLSFCSPNRPSWSGRSMEETEQALVMAPLATSIGRESDSSNTVQRNSRGTVGR